MKTTEISADLMRRLIADDERSHTRRTNEMQEQHDFRARYGHD